MYEIPTPSQTHNNSSTKAFLRLKALAMQAAPPRRTPVSTEKAFSPQKSKVLLILDAEHSTLFSAGDIHRKHTYIDGPDDNISFFGQEYSLQSFSNLCLDPAFRTKCLSIVFVVPR
jgi:hypothetical protein